MNVQLLDCPNKLEEKIIKDSSLYYNDINLTKSDLERFTRKCIRDENSSIFTKYVIVFKIHSIFSTYNELNHIGFNLSKPKFSFSNLNFSLPKNLQNNEKTQTVVADYLKKISLAHNQKSHLKENFLSPDEMLLLPQICEVEYIQSENLYECFNLCSLKEYNNISHELVSLSTCIYEKLFDLYSFLFNPATYKVFLRMKKNQKHNNYL